MKLVGFGNKDPEVASTIAGRLARLNTRLTKDDREQLTALSGGVDLSTITHQIVEALDPDHYMAAAAARGVKADDEASVVGVASTLLSEALKPLASNPELRNAIVDLRKSYEQAIDEISIDELKFVGYSEDAREKAAALVSSFTEYLEEHRDDIRALQVLYSRPYRERLTFTEIKNWQRPLSDHHTNGRPRSCGTPTRCSTSPRCAARVAGCSPTSSL
jgi:type I restriction enzyme R subunit